MDVAFYQYITTYPVIVQNYMPTDLEEAGYTYEYISPNNFDLEQAVVVDGILAPDAQEFKALIVRANDSMTVTGAEGIARFANDGLPIIFSGGVPTYLASYNDSGAAYVSQTLHSLTSMSNVHVVPYDGLAGSIASLGIKPITKVDANNTWYTYWRQTDDYNYVFVYNDALAPNTQGLGNGYSEGSIEFASLGTPYFFDAWTGEQICIAKFSQSKTSTTIPLHLAGNQSVIIAFDLSSTAPTNTGYNVADPSQSYPPASAGVTIDLTDWTLVIEHWDAPKDLSKMLPSDTVKYNTTHQLSDGLKSWIDMSPSLKATSGRGYYNTTFTWSSSNSSTNAAIIDFGAIFDTIRASVNGHVLPPLDPTWAKVDITEYLVTGDNLVEAVVATPLINTLRPISDQLMSAANGTGFSLKQATPPLDYGLLSPVKVIPYKR